MRRFRFIHRLTSDAELARVGLVLGPATAEQLRYGERAAQQAAFHRQCVRWLVFGLFAAALVRWLWDVCQGGPR